MPRVVISNVSRFPVIVSHESWGLLIRVENCDGDSSVAGDDDRVGASDGNEDDLKAARVVTHPDAAGDSRVDLDSLARQQCPGGHGDASA